MDPIQKHALSRSVQLEAMYLEALLFNLESRSEIQDPEKISLCCLLSAGTPTRGLSIVAARNFQPALEPIIEDT